MILRQMGMLMGKAAVPASVGGTWNPADNVGFNLSGGNLTATTPTTGNSGLRSTTTRNSGKPYYEFTNNDYAYTMIGIATSAAVLANGYNQTNVANLYTKGGAYINGVTNPTPVSGTWGDHRAVGQIIGIGIDIAGGTLSGYDSGGLQVVYSIGFSGPYFIWLAGTNDVGDGGTLIVSGPTPPVGYSLW